MIASNSNVLPARSESSLESQSSARPSATSVSVTILFEEKSAVFGWSEKTPAREFGEQLRTAVRHLTGISELSNMDIVTETDPPKKVTPRDVFERRYPEAAHSRFRIVLRASKPTPTVYVEDAEAKARIPEVSGPQSSAGRGQLKAPQRQPPSGKFQKAGGSQLQFLQMLEGNKNPKADLHEATVLTPEEVARHCKPGNCWTIFQGRVYDITLYIDFHPGGKRQIMQGAGKDMTELFQQAHPWVSMDGLLGKLCLGPLATKEGSISEAKTQSREAQVNSAEREMPVEVVSL